MPENPLLAWVGHAALQKPHGCIAALRVVETLLQAQIGVKKGASAPQMFQRMFEMASHTTNVVARPGFDFRAVLRAIDGFFASLSAATRMSQEIELLMALSDDELASRGLRRDDIVRHVFGMSNIG